MWIDWVGNYYLTNRKVSNQEILAALFDETGAITGFNQAYTAAMSLSDTDNATTTSVVDSHRDTYINDRERTHQGLTQCHDCEIVSYHKPNATQDEESTNKHMMKEKETERKSTTREA